jgi:microcin C transport system substrate-binding protein
MSDSCTVEGVWYCAAGKQPESRRYDNVSVQFDKQNNRIEDVLRPGARQTPAARWPALLAAVCLLLLAGTARSTPSVALGYHPKYPAGFSHFDYVNPAAPKGGELTLSAFGNFESLNPFLLKGIAAAGIGELVFESLMEQSLDEPYSLYAHLADDVVFAPDRLSVTFRLDPRARFSDGSAVTASDVKFSFDTLKSNAAHPRYRIYWTDIKRAVVLDARHVRFDFARVNPELHLIAAQMPVFARAWAAGQPFDKLNTTRPLGSGPYVVESYDFGKRVSYVRNPRYWAKDLGARRGMYNFERIVFKYYKDDTVRLEAFKAGEFEFIFENNSKKWARDYNGPQFDSGQIRRTELRHRNNAGMQGFVFNLRRPLFQDIRVRRAISLALDFEWSNRNLFYNQYTRCYSYFSNSELAATGLPGPEERALLEPYRKQLPAAVFTQEWKPPMTTPPSSLRANLIQAGSLLREAGWTLTDGVLRNANGERLEFEVLLAQKAFERILAPYARNLAKLGVRMHYRTVDVALYQRRSDTFDFDMIIESFGQSQSPGNELMGLWHSASAAQEGSNNIMGLSSPVVDALIQKVIYAPDRRHLVTATRALDRVLLRGEYLVPNWFIATHRIAYWDRFGIPQHLPLYYGADSWMLRTWWKKP